VNRCIQRNTVTRTNLFREPAIARRPVARGQRVGRAQSKDRGKFTDSACVLRKPWPALPVAVDGLARFTRASCGGSSPWGGLGPNAYTHALFADFNLAGQK
jgi:hypothetical protein